MPGFKAGGPIRSCAAIVHHLKSLADFYIVSRNTDYCETIPYNGVKSNDWNRISESENVYYISGDQLKIGTIKKLIESEIFSSIYINGIYSFYFSILPLYFSKKLKQKIIVAPRGMLARSAIAVKGYKKNIFIAAGKFFGLYEDVIFHSTSMEENSDILKVFGKNTNVKNAPNLTVLDNQKFVSREKKVGYLHLINAARISPEKNLLYALEILNEIDLNVKFDIYGTIYDTYYWNQCLDSIKDMPSNIEVKYHDAIENNLLSSKLESAHFLFMPTRGENFGHIIAESLSAGCPVIISDQTPWKQLAKKNIGWDIPLSSKNEFIKTIESCAMMNQETYDSMSLHSFTLASEMLNDNTNIELNKLIFDL